MVVEQFVAAGGCPLVNDYDWDVKTAYAVCMAESGGDPTARGVNTNGTDDVGLMQINSVHVPSLISSDARYDAAENIKAAYQVYTDASIHGDGWSAWSAYNSGKYLKFL